MFVSRSESLDCNSKRFGSWFVSNYWMNLIWIIWLSDLVVWNPECTSNEEMNRLYLKQETSLPDLHYSTKLVHVSAPSNVSLDAASHTPLAVANVSVIARHGHEALVKPHPVGAVWPWQPPQHGARRSRAAVSGLDGCEHREGLSMLGCCDSIASFSLTST